MTHYLTFDEVGITISVIGIALAFIVLVWNAARAIHDWRQMAKKPTTDRIEDHEQRISYLEGCCQEVHGKLASDFQFQKEEKEFNVLMLEAIGQLLKHATDGDDIEGLREVDKRINKYLLEQSQR